MKMTRSRGILASIFQVIMACCTAVLIFSFVMNLTVSSDRYYTSRFPSSAVAADCDKQLEMKFGELSNESGFPPRVFMMITQDTPTVQNVKEAMSNAISSGDGSIYSQNLKDYFYNLCKDYATGNNISCSEESLNATAEKATQLYCETVSVTGFENIEQSRSDLKHKVTLAQFVSFVVLLVCAFSTVLIYSRKRLSFTRILSAIEGGGLSTIFASLLVYLIKPVMSLDIEPLAYRESFSNMAGSYFITTALVAAAIVAVSVIIMVRLELEHEKSKDKVKIV